LEQVEEIKEAQELSDPDDKDNGLFSFGIAIEYLKEGYFVRRTGWKDAHLMIKDGDDFYHDQIVMYKTNGDNPYITSFTPTQEEMLEEDWELIELN